MSQRTSRFKRAARRLFGLAALLSLLLSVAATAMWSRSFYVTEAWQFAPVPGSKFLHDHYRAIESARGRLAFVEYEYWGWPPGFVSPAGGYSRSLVMLSPTRHGWAYSRTATAGTVHGRIPGVAEWWDTPGNPTRLYPMTRQRLIFVPWRSVALAGAVIPIVWVWRRWRGRIRGPAFPVLPAK